MVVARGREERELLFSGCRVSVLQDGEVLEIPPNINVHIVNNIVLYT